MSGDIKRRLPIVVVNAIEPIIGTYRSIISFKDKDNTLIHIVDSEDLNFFFTIKNRENTSSGLKNRIQLSPLDDRMEAYETLLTEQQLSDYLTNWCKRIEFYHKESILDDPILKAYNKEIKDEFNKIQLVDKDASSAPFNIYQQRFLVSFLKETDTLLEDYKSDLEDTDYKDIRKSITNTIKSISKETKQQVLNRISEILAKCRKSSFEFGEKCVTSFFKALASEAGKAVFKALAGYLTGNS